MPTETIGGLYGKARRKRVQNRAARLYTRQLVEEYLEPDEPSPLAGRYVPIRGRSEFLPSAAPALILEVSAGDNEQTASQASRQLDLGFGESKTPKTDRSPASSIAAAPDQSDSPESPAVLRVPARTKPQHEPSPPVPRASRPKPFTFGGFLLGCAMGSAAAVMGLMVAQAVVR